MTVVHLDAARSTVQWTQRNLLISGLAEYPVRFITDDCMTFVDKEIRRGKKYDALILVSNSHNSNMGY